MINGSIFSQFFFVWLRSLYVGTQIILFHLDYEQSYEIGILGFGGENEVVKEVFSFRNKVYLLTRFYFIILDFKFIIWYRLLEISNGYEITISYIYIYRLVKKTHLIVGNYFSEKEKL